MTPWNELMSGLLHLVSWLSRATGAPEVVVIVGLTLLARLALMPLGLKAALRSERSREKLALLQPQLDALKEKFGKEPAKLAAESLALRQRHGIPDLDGLGLLNGLVQGVLGLGWFQAIRKAAFSSRFLWIESLARPDMLLGGIVGLLALVAALLAPGFRPEPAGLLLVLLPVALSVVAAVTLPSSLGLYWAASNGFNALQALVLQGLRARKGNWA